MRLWARERHCAQRGLQTLVRVRSAGTLGGLDPADDIVGSGVDLVCDFPAMDIHIAWEIESDPDPLASNRGDADNADRVARVADDDFLAFSSGNYKHRLLPSWKSGIQPPATTENEYTRIRPIAKHEILPIR